MDSFEALRRLESAVERGEDRGRVFDWDKAARIIRDEKPRRVSAGLRDDWEWTGGCIFEGGHPVSEDYTYLSSVWAIPEIKVDGEKRPCWVWQDQTEWSAGTTWPASALRVLNSKS